jgi:hypothetical protein
MITNQGYQLPLISQIRREIAESVRTRFPELNLESEGESHIFRVALVPQGQKRNATYGFAHGRSSLQSEEMGIFLERIGGFILCRPFCDRSRFRNSGSEA